MMRENEFRSRLEQINLSEEQKKRIKANCLADRHTQNKRFLYSGQIAAALAVVILAGASVTAYAAVNAYQTYMERMSREEIRERYDQLHEGAAEADSFSRSLSQEERERLDQMLEAFRQGLCFPEKSMASFDGTDPAEADEIRERDISYDYVNMIFYLPERELTDEELLQIIDVWEKGNYSLGVVNGEQGAGKQGSWEEKGNQEHPAERTAEEEAALEKVKAEMQRYIHEVPESDAELLRQSALSTIKTLTGAEPADMIWNIELYGEDMLRYVVQIHDEKEWYNLVYTADSTPDDLTVYSYEYHELSGEKREKAEYTGEELLPMLPGLAMEAAAQLPEAYGIDEKIVACEYGYPQTVLTGDTTLLQFVLTGQAGNRYRLYYSLRREVFVNLLTYDAGKYGNLEDLFPDNAVKGEVPME